MRSVVSLRASEVRECRCPVCGRTPTRGTAGVKVVRDRRPIGVAVIAPPDKERDLCPPSAAIITQLWVEPDEVGEHIGTQLVQRLSGRLVSDGVRYLVAYGTRGAPSCDRLPAGWLERTGFTERVGGQWRLDLGRTVTWTDRVARTAAGLARAVRGSRERPAPANRS